MQLINYFLVKYNAELCNAMQLKSLQTISVNRFAAVEALQNI
jgi:hypothetical protein